MTNSKEKIGLFTLKFCRVLKLNKLPLWAINNSFLNYINLFGQVTYRRHSTKKR